MRQDPPTKTVFIPTEESTSAMGRSSFNPEVTVFAATHSIGARGGWCAIATGGSQVVSDRGGLRRVSPNRLELLAALGGLRLAGPVRFVAVRSESQYVVRGAQEWMRVWAEQGWTRADGSPVANQDLWQAIDEERRRHLSVTWALADSSSSNPIDNQARYEALMAAQSADE